MNNFYQIYEDIVIYDGSSPDVDCTISHQNQGKICEVKIIFVQRCITT